MTTDEKGNVVELADYYPYGEVRIEEKAEGYENDYLFTGQERDKETGLMYYGARYYDPAIGRFVSVDPWEGELTNPQTLNKYSYVVNNPLKYVDPTGKYLVFFTLDISQAGAKKGIEKVHSPNPNRKQQEIVMGQIITPEPMTQSEKVAAAIIGTLATVRQLPKLLTK